MADYDIAEAFKEIENELIDSMMRNFSRHRAEENKEGYLWSQWQAEQLHSLEKYRKENAKKFNKQFSELNGKIKEMLEVARADGNANQEIKILEAIKNGFKPPQKPSKTSTGEFFKVNDRKLNSLIKATTDDFERAETAILRMSNDKYRKAIFNAQVYANSGAGTYEKAVDMACRDMLRAGLNCIEYKNGARHTLPDYAEMAIRTANKRAYLMGEGDKRKEWGITTVVVNNRQGGCPDCAPYIGRVFIDDVYSGGKEADGKYPLLSEAIAGGLFHPRCKDSTSTYYEGITTLKPVSKEEIEEMKERENLEAQENYYKNQAEKNGRIAKYSLDEENKRVYSQRAKAAEEKAKGISENINNFVAKSEKSGIINLRGGNMGLSITIDKFTPCLIDKSTGEIVNTKYSVANKKELTGLKKQGWNFNWLDKGLSESKIYKLTLDNDNAIQGLIAFTDFPRDNALYINIAESAPHNLGKNKKYEGVGGHLFAIAANESVKKGYGGFLFLDAKNTELVKYYSKKFGATLLGMPHPYRMFIDETNAQKLLKIYTLKGE